MVWNGVGMMEWNRVDENPIERSKQFRLSFAYLRLLVVKGISQFGWQIRSPWATLRNGCPHDTVTLLFPDVPSSGSIQWALLLWNSFISKLLFWSLPADDTVTIFKDLSVYWKGKDGSSESFQPLVLSPRGHKMARAGLDQSQELDTQSRSI